jgi:hypothetical protein
MIRRPKLANGLGYLGLGLSSLYPLLLFLGAAKHHFDSEQFMMFLDDLFYVWLLVWPVGLLLSIAAMVLGSRRWGWAISLPALSCWLSMMFLARIPF